MPAEPTAKTTHPTGFWFIFFGELAERCSFYGMRILLVMYLVQVFGYVEHRAFLVMHLYMAACYFAPLLGGFVADRFLGKYWTIVGFSVPYVAGQFVVGLSNEYLMYGALALLALGSGVIKPNISTLMGMTYDQQRPGQDKLRSQAFSWFYVAINLGSFFSYNVCPWVRDKVGRVTDEQKRTLADPEAGYMAGFMVPAVLMAVALAVFAVGKKYYGVEPARAETKTDPESVAARWRVVGRVGGLFFLVMFFWAVFDQKTTTWLWFAKEHLDLNVNVGLFEFRIAPEQMQSLNPLFIILFVPMMNRVYAALEARGFDVRPTTKMTAGFLLTAACMGIHAVAGYVSVNADGSVTRISVVWQALAFLALTIAEILISITGLELSFTAAPASLKSFVTSLWLVTVGLANVFINTPVTQLYPSPKPASFSIFEGWLDRIPRFHSPGDYFAFMTAVMLAVTAAFVVVARRFNRVQEMQAKSAS
jgi:POT family proton-dependent oligopeptide transporter